MPKRLKILSILALISLVGSLLAFRWDLLFWSWSSKILTNKQLENDEGFFVPNPTPEYKPEENLIEEKPLPILKDPPVGFYIFSPVEKEYLESASIDPENPKSIAFFLPAQASIKAIFSGKVKEILHNQKPLEEDVQFEQILLEKDDGEILASYIIRGEVWVKEGDFVGEGSILAKITKEGLNFAFWLNNKNGDFIKLSKEMFRE